MARLSNSEKWYTILMLTHKCIVIISILVYFIGDILGYTLGKN